MTDTNQIQHPEPLTDHDFTAADEPLRLFAAWFDEARRSEPDVPDAMALATVGLDGIPNVRMVLLKGFDEAGFVFYSHLDSQKGRELGKLPAAALSFHWKSLKRQVRVRGTMELVTDAEADAYFATRPRGAQLGAHASKQSQALESRLAFEKALAVTTAKYAIGTVPRPPRWTGFRIVPQSIEFWHDRPFRLHDRVEFTREKPGAPWVKTRLYP